MRNRSDIKESGRNRGNIITGNSEMGNTETGNTLTGNTQKAKIVLLAMVLCLWGAGGRTSYAAQDTSQDISKDISQTGAASTTPETAGNTAGAIIIEYGNLRELLKQGNLSLKESIEDYEDNINAYQEIWDTLKREQDNMEDKAEEMGGEDSQTAGIYSSNAAMLKSSASRIYKELALQFCTAYSAILSKNTVIATGTTGRMLAQTTGLPVHCYLSGRLGGVQQITSRIACDEVDLVLFFRDPLKADAASITEQNLLRLCDMHSVPIATNIATAEVLLRGMDQGDLDYREGMHPALVEPMPTVQRHAV